MGKIKKFNSLYLLTAYNLGFLGSMRESSTLSGHYKIVTDLQEFVIVKFGDYQNLVSVKEDIQSPSLTASDIRFVNDYMVGHLSPYDLGDATDMSDVVWDSIYNNARELMTSLWKTEKHYPYVNARISYNIQPGDTFVDLFDGKQETCTYEHDLKYINRNYKFKLIDRECHPEPLSETEFLTLQHKAISPLLSWDTNQPISKGAMQLKSLTIDTDVYNLYWDCIKGVYYIYHNGVTFSYKSTNNNALQEVIDYLIGLVYRSHNSEMSLVNYVTKQVASTDPYDRFEIFSQSESYRYNTRATYLDFADVKTVNA